MRNCKIQEIFITDYCYPPWVQSRKVLPVRGADISRKNGARGYFLILAFFLDFSSFCLFFFEDISLQRQFSSIAFWGGIPGCLFFEDFSAIWDFSSKRACSCSPGFEDNCFIGEFSSKRIIVVEENSLPREFSSIKKRRSRIFHCRCSIPRSHFEEAFLAVYFSRIFPYMRKVPHKIISIPVAAPLFGYATVWVNDRKPFLKWTTPATRR